MKQPYSEPNFARSDSKRKGKEKAVDSSLHAEMGWRSAMHGVAYCDGTCQPGPSCVLFPRRPDGKVVLPDPQERFFKPGNARRAILPAADSKPNYHQYREVPKAPPSSSVEPENDPPPIRSRKIESYAQLSSLPQFKAFRMDQDNGEGKNSRQSTRRQAATANSAEASQSASQRSSSPQAGTNVDLEWQQWKMREIRVVKRRRKQEYIRSGTHDFSIRLWSKYEA